MPPSSRICSYRSWRRWGRHYKIPSRSTTTSWWFKSRNSARARAMLRLSRLGLNTVPTTYWHRARHARLWIQCHEDAFMCDQNWTHAQTHMTPHIPHPTLMPTTPHHPTPTLVMTWLKCNNHKSVLVPVHSSPFPQTHPNYIPILYNPNHIPIPIPISSQSQPQSHSYPSPTPISTPTPIPSQSHPNHSFHIRPF